MQCNIPTMIYQSNIYSRIGFFFFKTHSVPILDPVSSGARPSRSRWSAFVTNFHGNARWEEAIGRSQGGKRFPDAIVCDLLEESIVPFSYQSCTVQPQHLATKPWCTSCRRSAGNKDWQFITRQEVAERLTLIHIYIKFSFSIWPQYATAQSRRD